MDAVATVSLTSSARRGGAIAATSAALVPRPRGLHGSVSRRLRGGEL